MRDLDNLAEGRLLIGEASFRFIDLPRLFGDKLRRLPVVLRVLLENVIRNTEGAERADAVAGILEWANHGTSKVEIPFQPSRVLMHDTTSTPALVDLAAMRDALAEAGADPNALNPVLPVDSSVDHSLAVEYFSRQDAAPLNLQLELKHNEERYQFLRWASKAFTRVRIHPPGTGIMHTINLEQLATVVSIEERENGPWAVPDTLIGTDSHTPMVNGIGVLGWGVGGLGRSLQILLWWSRSVFVKLAYLENLSSFLGPVLRRSRPAIARWSRTWRQNMGQPPAFSRSIRPPSTPCAPLIVSPNRLRWSRHSRKQRPFGLIRRPRQSTRAR
jgi:hypothetical protein